MDALEAFRTPQMEGESAEDYEARCCRAGQLVRETNPDGLDAEEKVKLSVLEELYGMEESQRTNFLKLKLFEAIEKDDRVLGDSVLLPLLRIRKVKILPGADASSLSTFFHTPPKAESLGEESPLRRGPLSLPAALPVSGGAPSAGPPATGQDPLMEVLVKQVEALSNLGKALEHKDKPKQSVIQVTPQLKWPILGNEGPKSRQIQEFYDKYERICGLANDGRGMPDVELLRVLGNCLKGSRARVYENEMKLARRTGLDLSDPRKAYDIIKSNMMRFRETDEERGRKVRLALKQHVHSRRTLALRSRGWSLS